MSQEHVEIMQRSFEAFNRRDIERAAADYATDFEYAPTGLVAGSEGVYRGVDAYVAFLDQLFEDFDDVHMEIDEIVDAGDRVLISLTANGRGRQSGVDTNWSYCQVFTFRDDKIIHGQGFVNREDAAEAAGLSE